MNRDDYAPMDTRLRTSQTVFDLRHALDEDEVVDLQRRTRERQKAAFQALLASGKSLLSEPVKRLESQPKKMS